MAQIALATLFAKAMATSILGFLISIWDSQDLSEIVFRPIQFKRESNRGFLPLRQCSRRWCVSVRPRVRGVDKTCVQTAFHRWQTKT